MESEEWGVEARKLKKRSRERVVVRVPRCDFRGTLYDSSFDLVMLERRL